MNKYTVCALVDGIFKSETITASCLSAAKYRFFIKQINVSVYILGVYDGVCDLVPEENTGHPLPLCSSIKSNGWVEASTDTGWQLAIKSDLVGKIKNVMRSKSGWQYIAQFNGLPDLLISDRLFEVGAFNVLSVEGGQT